MKVTNRYQTFLWKYKKYALTTVMYFILNDIKILFLTIVYYNNYVL